jgi:flagellar hook assembly protein FlgD
VEEVTVDVQNPGNAQLIVVIFNLSGQKVKTLYNSTGKDGLRLLWNGTDEKGNLVSPGVYLCRINNVTRRIVYNGRQ